jgi:hypothetical protein
VQTQEFKLRGRRRGATPSRWVMALRA